MKTIRLRIAYNGTHYSGWQTQPERKTVQTEVESAIEKLTQQKVNLLCAGRTDAGVHALGQVASFRSDFKIPPHRWRPALQSKLPEDIVILESDEVPEDFHATYAAISKRYRYVIYNSQVDHPFWKDFVWRIAQELDAEKMNEAAQSLVGKHDFRSFESHWPNKATSVRTIKAVSVQRLAQWDLWSPAHSGKAGNRAKPEGEFIVLEIEADGFLYNMVRTITGTLVNVGRGRWPLEDVQRILDAQDRKTAGGTAPASGLYLAKVYYEV